MRRPWGGARREADGRHEGVWAWSGRTGGRGGSHGCAPAAAISGTRENTKVNTGAEQSAPTNHQHNAAADPDRDLAGTDAPHDTVFHGAQRFSNT